MTYDGFVRTLSDLGVATRDDPQMRATVERVVAGLAGRPLTRDGVAAFIHESPDAVPILATCAGLGQEQLKNQLRHRLGTANWARLVRSDPAALVAQLDDAFELVAKIREQFERSWTIADVLLERHLWSRGQGASSVGQGRNVEDEVERVVLGLGLPYAMRTRYSGRGGTAPCDLAIPGGGDEASIVVGIKAFNSTGSKLTDAVTEIEKMATVRLPRQYVYAVVDGIGWLSRQADLRRLYSLWEEQHIDGLYNLSNLDELGTDLRHAAIRLGLTAPGR